MSYEGFEVLVCENGHCSTRDCYDCDSIHCLYCEAKIEFVGQVDETNGLPYPVRFEIHQKTPEKLIYLRGTYEGREYKVLHCVEHPTFEFVELANYKMLEEGDFVVTRLEPVLVEEDNNGREN